MPTEPNSQQNAILHSQNKVKLIEAVAGAGKTTTLAMQARKAWGAGVPERSILALCFSSGAAGRFRKKLKEEISARIMIEVMTVDDFAHKLIDDLAKAGHITAPGRPRDVEGIRGELVAATDRVWQRYQEQGIRTDFNFGVDENNQHLDDIARHLALMKAALGTASFAPRDGESIDDYDDGGDDLAYDAASQVDPITDIIREYEAHRHPSPEEIRWQGPNDAVSDLVYLLGRHPTLAREMKLPYRLYLVDEWHDVNAAEFELLVLLRGGARLVVAGDKDQTINRERGANPVFSGKRFDEAYGTEIKRFPLGMSYRFGRDAAVLADGLMDNGCAGHPERDTEVQRIRYDPGQPDACAKLVARTIVALQKNHPDLSNRDFAIVLRDVDQSVEVEAALMEAKIRYKCFGFETFLLLPEILLLRGILHYVSNNYTALQGSPDTCVQMVLALSRYFYLTRDPDHWKMDGAEHKSVLGYAQEEVRRTPEVLKSFFDGALLRETEFDSPMARQSKNLMRPVIAKMAELNATATAHELLTMLRDGVDLHDATSRAFVNRDRVASARRSIDAFLRFSARHGKVPVGEFLNSLSRMENDVSLQRTSNRVNTLSTFRSLVRVTTIQAAKGEEWPCVLMPFLEQREFLRTSDGRNEMRHLYVGLTRVMRKLVLFEPDDAHIGQRLAYRAWSK
jgi:DNA helicase-2/ATP-dependent DNA helicase PcrA